MWISSFGKSWNFLLFLSYRFSAYDVKRLRIYLGANNIKTGPRSEHRVKRIIKHRDFNPSALVNDIAILTLETPARMSNSVKTICLPTISNSYVNRRVTVTGWGNLKEGGSSTSTLQEVDLTVMSNGQCQKKYNSNKRARIYDSMICASDPGKDSCQVRIHLQYFLFTYTNNYSPLLGGSNFGFPVSNRFFPGQ